MAVSNWAGNIQFTPAELERPSSVPELQQLVARSSRVRALGSGHSFNAIADTTGVLVSVAGLPPVIEVDSTAATARVSAGLRYGQITGPLQAAGLALPNLGSLPHISIAGACATGTHGSGSGNPILATSVRALTLVTAAGDLLRIDRSDPGFEGSVLALGRLGIVAELELDVVPAYDVRQTVLVGLGDDAVAGHLQEILDSAYSVSVFTSWTPGSSRVWLKERVGDDRRAPDDLWGGRASDHAEHPVPGLLGDSATQQLGEPGRWFERIPHFRMEFTPSAGDELQSEYLVPAVNGAAAYDALTQIAEQIAVPLMTGEIRSIAGDSLWLSATGGNDCVAFHFTWHPDLAAVLPVLDAIEERLLPLGARPHWGKVFTTSNHAFPGLYPRLGDFSQRVRDLDPDGVFGSDLVDGWIGL